ncbi:hypothetical protein [Actinacidiphila sp. bgisy167]|uniref:hypothetical protein n=1 Tax=Actinacidiphila sp. bgisy167 TaxID=3413797 RepID=UPI003D72C9BD
MLVSVAAMGMAVAAAAAVSAPQASADGTGLEPRRVNTLIAVYPSDTMCVQTRDALNAAQDYPNYWDEYYYCAGDGHNALWFRHLAR